MKEELREQLQKDFSDFSCYVQKEKSGNTLRMSSNWKGRTPGVKKLAVHLTGVNPLTGEQVDTAGICAVFTAETSSYKSDILTYHGRYKLRFSAYLDNGEVISDFREPKEVEFVSSAKKPYIKYGLKKLSEFTQITVECNCWRMVENNVWLKLGSRGQQRYQPLPVQKQSGQKMTCVLPTVDDIGVEVSDELKKFQIEVKDEKQKGWTR